MMRNNTWLDVSVQSGDTRSKSTGCTVNADRRPNFKIVTVKSPIKTRADKKKGFKWIYSLKKKNASFTVPPPRALPRSRRARSPARSLLKRGLNIDLKRKQRLLQNDTFTRDQALAFVQSTVHSQISHSVEGVRVRVCVRGD